MRNEQAATDFFEVIQNEHIKLQSNDDSWDDSYVQSSGLCSSLIMNSEILSLGLKNDYNKMSDSLSEKFMRLGIRNEFIQLQASV